MSTLRPEVTDRSALNAGARTEAESQPPPSPIERVAFTIAEFCERNHISPSTYHKNKRALRGPAEMRDGRLVRITRESELAWQRQLTHPEGAEAKARTRDEAATKERGRHAGRLAAQSPRHVSKRKRSRGVSEVG
jgi:hypothetical protein